MKTMTAYVGCPMLMWVLLMDVAVAQPGPKYQPGSFPEGIGGSIACLARCSGGPMRISPDPIEACEGEVVSVNVRVEGNRMSTFGDAQEGSGGSIDWGDGKSDGLGGSSCCSWDVKHTYIQAKTYHASAAFAEQHNNANNPPGGCSYRCRLQQAATVVIHLKSSPECSGGALRKAKKKP